MTVFNVSGEFSLFENLEPSICLPLRQGTLADGPPLSSLGVFTGLAGMNPALEKRWWLSPR